MMAAADPGPSWTLAGSLTGIVQNKSVLLQPALTFDRGPLHLETRYNSEDRDTFSLFAGWNLEWVKLQLTPMLGALAGRTKGIAPEIDLTLTWGQFKLSGGAEYIFDFSDTAEDYFSAWSGLTMSPLAWLQFGLALQRTRVIRSPREVQLGPQLGISFWKMSATFSLYNPGFQGEYASLGLEVTF